MSKSILFHVSDQELMPSQSEYRHISEIDSYDDSSIQEIVYQDLCDFLKEDDAPDILKKAYDKLQTNGIIHIQGTDLKQLGVAIAFHSISEDIAKRVLYDNNKKSIRCLSDMISILKSLNFKIRIKKYINIFEYYIQAYK